MSAAQSCDIDRIVQRVNTLPRLPGATVRLLGVINDPRSTVKDIVEIIRYDQTVTAELLKLVNSAAMGLIRKIHSVDEAVCYLGTKRVMQILLAAHTKVLLGPEQSGYGLAPGALWAHCVSVAIGCQTIAKRLNLDDVGLLFTAGLLHDVGKVVLNETLEGLYGAIVQCARDEKIGFAEAEQRILGYTHAEVGARVAERWGLPEAIIECIRHHHQPDAATPSVHIDTVHVADVISLLMGIGSGDDSMLYYAHPSVLSRLSFTENDVAVMSAEIVAEFKIVESLFRPSK